MISGRLNRFGWCCISSASNRSAGTNPSPVVRSKPINDRTAGKTTGGLRCQTARAGGIVSSGERSDPPVGVWRRAGIYRFVPFGHKDQRRSFRPGKECVYRIIDDRQGWKKANDILMFSRTSECRLTEDRRPCSNRIAMITRSIIRSGQMTCRDKSNEHEQKILQAQPVFSIS